MRSSLLLGAIAVGIAAGSFIVRQYIIAQQQQRGLELHGDKISAQIENIRQSQALRKRQEQHRQQLAKLVDSLARSPQDTSLVLPIGMLMLQTGDTLGAIAMYRRYVDSINSSNVVALTDYAFLLYLAGDRRTGHQLTAQAVKRAPRYQVALYNMAVMEYELNRISSAISWMERCRSVDSTSSLGQLAGRALDELHKMQHAASQ